MSLAFFHFPRDYTRPDLPTGDCEGPTAAVTHSGFPDIAAAISGTEGGSRRRRGEGGGMKGRRN